MTKSAPFEGSARLTKFDFAPYSGPRIALFSRVSEMVARVFANPSDSGGVEKLDFSWFPWLF
jgi:hypothetical protein